MCIRDRVKQCGFSASVCTDQCGNSPLVKRKVQSVQHLLLSVGKGKIFYGKNITGHSLVTPKLMTIMIASSTAKLRLNHDCFVVVIVSTSIHL